MSIFDAIKMAWKDSSGITATVPEQGKVDWEAINAATVDSAASKTLVANAIGEAVEGGARLKL